MLTALDKTRIAEAIDKAERATSGEILCALTGEVSNYREVPLAWGAAVALSLPPLALAIGFKPLTLAGQAGMWFAAQGSALEGESAFLLGGYALVQLILFVGVVLLVRIPAIRRRLTPRSLKRHRVDRAAQHYFSALAASARAADTGVLIFVATDDRQVRIIAAPSLHGKADETAWARAANTIGAAMRAGHDPTSGIVEAIEICGSALMTHFPASAGQSHVFSARPIDA